MNDRVSQAGPAAVVMSGKFLTFSHQCHGTRTPSFLNTSTLWPDLYGSDDCELWTDDLTKQDHWQLWIDLNGPFRWLLCTDITGPNHWQHGLFSLVQIIDEYGLMISLDRIIGSYGLMIPMDQIIGSVDCSVLFFFFFFADYSHLSVSNRPLLL